MNLTPAYQSLAALQERMTSGTYLGAEAVVHYGDPVKEFATLSGSFGVFKLDWRAKISVTGKDRVRWLHNMVTNNVRDLAPNRGNYNFVLNAQGRILGDMYIYNRGESFMIDTDQSQVEPLLAAMKRFIIMDKVEMNVVPTAAFGICGPQAGESGVFNASGMEPLEIRELNSGQLAVRGPLHPAELQRRCCDLEAALIKGHVILALLRRRSSSTCSSRESLLASKRSLERSCFS